MTLVSDGEGEQALADIGMVLLTTFLFQATKTC